MSPLNRNNISLVVVLQVLCLLFSFRPIKCQVGLSDTNQAKTKAIDWLIKEWIQPRAGVPASKTGGWPDADTARILTGLQLADNAWLASASNKDRAEIALRQMNSEILSGLLRTSNMSSISGEAGAEYVNALLATCQNPRDFYGHDLIAMLTRRIGTIPSGSGTKNVVQVISAAAALCHAGAPVPSAAIQRINSELKPTSGACAYCVESSSLAILAMKCIKDRPGPVDQLVAGINTRQIAYVKGKQDDDGGFGDLFSTNLAIQAANAVGTVNLPINVAKALEYILQDQNKQTGSFGNPVLTSFVLPTLTGRSILDVRSVSCPASRSLDDPVPSGKIRTTLVIEDTIYAQRRVETKIDATPGKTILGVMNEQSAKHPRAFKFSTGAGNGGTQLTGLNSVINDSKNNWNWRVQRAPRGGSAQLVPALDKVNVLDGDKIFFRFGRN